MLEHTKIDTDALIASFRTTQKQIKRLHRVQIGLILVCALALIAAIAFKMMGHHNSLVLFFALAGMLCGVGVQIAGKKVEPLFKNLEKMKDLANNATAEQNKSQPTKQPKISLTIGFANFSGEDLQAIATEDATVLAPLFEKVIVAPYHQIPIAEVLFVYAHLNEEGTMVGLTSASIRQIVQLTHAKIVVVASPNSSSSIQKALKISGPETANLVFTQNRNADGFQQFFGKLFEKMRDGQEMLEAWAQLAPQTPFSHSTNTPQLLLVAEAGKMAFSQK